MRILLYTYTALPKIGGQETVVDALARQFIAKGHTATVLAPYPRQRLELRDRDFPYEMIRHPRFYSSRMGVKWYRHFLRRQLAKSTFDILHCHGVYPSGYVVSLLDRENRPPLVLTAHGGDVYADSRRIQKPGLRPRFVRAVGAADRLIAISPFTRQAFLDLHADPAKIISISNGVDVESIAASAARPDELPARFQPGEYFLFMGRLKLQKGVDVLLKALARLQNKRLVIAGDGAERASLESLTEKLHLSDRVYFTGAVHGQTKNYLFQNCICTIVPSRLFEAFGLVVIESYAASRPVIVTDLPGLANLVRPGQTGCIVTPDNDEQLADAMLRMLEQASRMSAAARQTADEYAWPSIADQHLTVYQRLIG